jgi:hypothetical protein
MHAQEPGEGEDYHDITAKNTISKTYRADQVQQMLIPI